MDFSYFENILKEFHRPLHDPVLVFALILMIILFSPLILKRFKVPGIIGLIISGMIFGPYGINLLEKNSAVDLFSTIGLLYIMFIAGLELDMNNFRKSKHKSIAFGFLSFAIPFSMGFPIGYYILGYNFDASLLIAILFATHTMVAYPIISKYGLIKNEAVVITVGGTILTDTTVLIILAINLSSSQGHLNNQFWLRLGISLVLFMAIMFIVIPKVSKWFLTKLESEKTSHYIYILSVVFLAAFLARVAGLDPIIGAFAAGLALNRLIPQSSTLMSRIEFIGNSIFIPFFLISVGMIVNLRVFFGDWFSILIAVLLTTAALTSKWLAALTTQVIFRYSSLQRQLIFSLSSSHAAAILAVALVGFNSHIIDERILNSTIVIILITCIVASFVAERTAKKLLLLKKNDEDITPYINKKNYEHILIPLANFSNLEILFEFAALLKDKKSNNPITILSVVPNDKEAEKNLQKARKNLDSIVKLASSSEAHVNVIATIDHNIGSGIVRTSKEIMADIILLGWPHKSKFVDKFIGEKTDNIIQDTDKNIFVCFIDKPLITCKKMIILAPPFCELEMGFELWLYKIINLSQELSIGITCFCNRKTRIAMDNFIKKTKPVSIQFNNFGEWNDFLVLSRNISENDLLVFISARKDAASYHSYMDNLSMKLEKHFPVNLKILVYSQQNQSDNKFLEYKDVNAEPLTRGIKTIQKIGKGLGGIMKK